MEKFTNLAGRILLAHLLLVAGFGKITGYASSQGYMDTVGVPGALLPLVIGLEIGGALALILGWQTRLVAFALAGFSLASATIFHAGFSNDMQTILLMKHLAIAGGLLLVAAQDPVSSLGLKRRRLATASA